MEKRELYIYIKCGERVSLFRYESALWNKCVSIISSFMCLFMHACCVMCVMAATRHLHINIS